MEKIVIDLRQLTQAHADEALRNMGHCYYSAPCIIGTLLTPEQRKRLDDWNIPGLGPVPAGSYDVGVLHTSGIIEFAEEGQLEAAEKLQGAFDGCEEEMFAERFEQWLLTGEIVTN